MEIIELFLVLVTAVLLSALLDRALPNVAAPLVQVATGLAMALVLSMSPVIEADIELFMIRGSASTWKALPGRMVMTAKTYRRCATISTRRNTTMRSAPTEL